MRGSRLEQPAKCRARRAESAGQRDARKECGPRGADVRVLRAQDRFGLEDVGAACQQIRRQPGRNVGEDRLVAQSDRGRQVVPAAAGRAAAPVRFPPARAAGPGRRSWPEPARRLSAIAAGPAPTQCLCRIAAARSCMTPAPSRASSASPQAARRTRGSSGTDRRPGTPAGSRRPGARAQSPGTARSAASFRLRRRPKKSISHDAASPTE